MTDDDSDETTPVRIVTDGEHTAYSAHFATTPHSAFEADINRRVGDLEKDTASLKASRRTLEMDVLSLSASRRFWRWVAGLGIPAILGASVIFLLHAEDRITTSSERVGETRAQIAALSKQIDSLQQEVLMLLRLSGVDPKAGISISTR